MNNLNSYAIILNLVKPLKDMSDTKFIEKIQINHAQEAVFDYTQDYTNRLVWDTFLKKAELVGGVSAAKGVKAFCVAQNGLGMETEYVTFNRPKVTAIKMTKGPYMFISFLGSWTFKKISPYETEVIFLYSFQLRFPFTAIRFFINRNLRSNVRQRLKDLKACIEKN